MLLTSRHFSDRMGTDTDVTIDATVTRAIFPSFRSIDVPLTSSSQLSLKPSTLESSTTIENISSRTVMVLLNPERGIINAALQSFSSTCGQRSSDAHEQCGHTSPRPGPSIAPGEIVW